MAVEAGEEAIEDLILLRAVTLDALVAAAGQDDRVRVASWYTLRNVDAAVAGRCVGVVSELRDGLSARVDEDVARMWSPSPATSKLTMPAVSTDGLDAGSFDVDGLDDFRTAVQPYSGGNNPAQVAQLVGQHMPAILEGFAEILTEAVAAASTAHKDELRTYGTELGKKLRETLTEHQRSIEAIERRSKLLWWRMSGRSDALDCRYSDAGSAAVAALAAAVDVHYLLGQPAPRSVEHLIVDMIEDSGFADTEVTVEDLAGAGAQFGLEIAAPADSTPRPLVAAVVGCEPGQIAASLSAPATAPERAVTLFRELQADELLRKSGS